MTGVRMWKYWGRGIDRYREGRRGRYWKNEDVGGGIFYLNPSPYPCLLRTEHMKSSRGRPCSSLRGTFPFPVVCPYRPNICLNIKLIYWCGKKASLTKKRKRMNNNRCKSAFKDFHVLSNELKTLEWDILNPDQLINLSWKL